LNPQHPGDHSDNDVMESDVSLAVALRERGPLPPAA
jgi:hypothetical protein